MIERRARRSDVRTEALSLFLESQRGTLASRGLAVVTGGGHVLASAGPKGKALAAAVESGARRVATWRLRVGDVDVVLASEGGRLSHDLGCGVKRILTA